MLTPKAVDLTHLARCRNQLLEWNDMHNFKGLTMTIQWAGVARHDS
jgi:hypothetical protein